MCHVSCVMCYVSHVACHMSRVMRPMSHVNKKHKKTTFFFEKVVKLVVGESDINGALRLYLQLFPAVLKFFKNHDRAKWINVTIQERDKFGL